MNKIKNILYPLMVLVFIGTLSMSCEFKEPFPDPSATLEVWGVNPETNAYEVIPEPYQLTAGVAYDFQVEGNAEQFVIWFGIPGNPEKTSPSGSDFTDRGVNHFSSGTVVVNNTQQFTYRTDTTYNLVLVASSYNYATEEYKEILIEKTIVVSPATVK